MNYPNQQQDPQQEDSSTTNKLISAMSTDNNTDPSLVHFRLQTTELLQDIQFLLEGKDKIEEFDETTGVRTVKLLQVCPPKANQRGVFSICRRVKHIVNPSMVQGNLTNDDIRYYVGEFRESLNDALILNNDDWGVADADYEDIIDAVVDTIYVFMTRTKDNKEREHLSQSTKYVETSGNGSSNGGGFFANLLPRGK